MTTSTKAPTQMEILMDRWRAAQDMTATRVRQKRVALVFALAAKEREMPEFAELNRAFTVAGDLLMAARRAERKAETAFVEYLSDKADTAPNFNRIRGTKA